MANVLGIKVHLLKSEEGPSMGAAMLAMVAAGEYENVKQAADSIVGICRTIEPEKTLQTGIIHVIIHLKTYILH